MTTRWKRFYQKQMEDAKLRNLVETELENLQLEVQIAEAARSRESEPDKAGGQGGNERAKDFGDGE
jgi:hypothetical protein